tara:strand:+ start:293 stop:1084 length:792 start_codon:yes stop_codon:yes gene_type:complete
MKRYKIISCKDFSLSCELNIRDRFNKELSIFIFFNSNGYIKSIPFTNDICKFLAGGINLSEIVVRSKSILFNNVNIDIHDLSEVLLKSIDININQLSIKNKNLSNINLVLNLLVGDARNGHDARHINPYNKSTRNTIDDKISHVIHAVSTLDVSLLHPLLKEDMTYMRMNIYRFLNYMHNKYDEFKKEGNTYLKFDKIFFNSNNNNHISDELGLKKNFEGVIVLFHGNKTNKQLSFLLRTKESKVLSISTITSKKIKQSIKSK